MPPRKGKKRKRKKVDSESESEEVIRGRSKPLKKEGLDGLNIAEYTKESMFRKVVELAPDLSQTTEQDIRDRLSRKFDFDWRKPFLKIIPTGTQQPLMRTEVLNIIWGLAAHTLVNDVFSLSQKHYIPTGFLDGKGHSLHARCTDFSGDGVFISYSKNVVMFGFYTKEIERYDACVEFERVMDLVRKRTGKI